MLKTLKQRFRQTPSIFHASNGATIDALETREFKSKSVWVVLGTAALLTLVGISATNTHATVSLLETQDVNTVEVAAQQSAKASAEAQQAAQTALRENLNSIKFIKNQGQWPVDILYVGKSLTGSVSIFKDKIAFSTPQFRTPQNGATEGLEGGDIKTQQVGVQDWVLNFEGSQGLSSIDEGGAFVTQYSYMTGSDIQGHVSQAPALKEITLRDVYSGIDLRLYSREAGKLEFDWLVDAGVDYSQIKMTTKGVDGMSVLESGALEIDLRHSDIRMDLPETYQVSQAGKQLLDARFSVDAGFVSYELIGDIDPDLPLVIDPDVDWGTYMDSNIAGFDQYLYAVDVTSGFVAYVAGNTDENIPMGAGSGYMETLAAPYDTTQNGQIDGIIYALSADGTTVLYATHFGGSDQDLIFDVSVSPDESAVWVGGQTESNSGGENFPITADAIDGTLGSTRKGFVAKFSGDLSTLNYSSYIGSGDNGQYVGGTSIVPSETVFEVVALDANNVIIGAILGAANANLITAGTAADSTYGGVKKHGLGN